MKSKIKQFHIIMGKRIGRIVKSIVGSIMKYTEKNPCVIMYIDGGFSSQMLRYCKGMWFQERGMDVKFDLQWYEKNGKDDLGIETREWRLKECFPELMVKVASEKEVNRYRKFYGTNIHKLVKKYENKEEKLAAPLYVSLYDFDYLVSFKDCPKYFNWQGMYNLLTESAKKIATEIMRYKKNGRNVIGVHVRRGDMAVSGSYWKVLTAHYFEAAINEVVTEESIIYFFSNGFDFVKREVLPYIKNEYVMVDNGFKDYEDIYLYSLCNVQIASQGSWGELAYCFNTAQNRTLVIPDYSAKQKYESNDNGKVIHLYLEENMYLQS